MTSATSLMMEIYDLRKVQLLIQIGVASLLRSFYWTSKQRVYIISRNGDSNFVLLLYRKIKHTGIHPSTFWYIWYAVDHCLPCLTTFINNYKGLYLGAFGSQWSAKIFVSICPSVCNKEAQNLEWILRISSRNRSFQIWLKSYNNGLTWRPFVLFCADPLHISVTVLFLAKI